MQERMYWKQQQLDIKTKKLYLQHQLLYSASSMNPQQREEQFEMSDALRLRT